MALREIRTDEDPILRKKSRPIELIDEKIITLINDMVETMHHAEGIGLAAPQIGILKQVVVVEFEEQLFKMINPSIVNSEGNLKDIEGCLSVPNKKGIVERPETITVNYISELGENKTIDATGYLARVFCHEIDHLNGILYTDIADVVENVYENHKS